MIKKLWPLALLIFLFPLSAIAGVLDALGCISSGSCGLSDIEAGFQLLTNWLLGGIGALAILYFIWGAVQWITSAGKSAKVEHGKEIMINTVVAIVIAFTSFLLIQFFVNDVLLGGQPSEYSINADCVGQPQEKSCNQPLLNYVCTGTFSEPEKVQYNELCVVRCVLQGMATGQDWACLNQGSFITTNETQPLANGCASETQVCVDTKTVQLLQITPPTTTPGFIGAGCNGVQVRGINQRQCNDATDSLSSLIGCMKERLNNSFVITSISDNIAVNNLSRCQASNYDSSCAHTRNSCHYGGADLISKSCAADFNPLGDTTRNDILQAAQSCGAAYAQIENSPAHVHASVSGCRCDGHN